MVMTAAETLRARAWEAAAAVVDPEIPVLSIADLGVLRDVRVAGGRVEVVITPTYSGCPAMHMIAAEIRLALARAGLGEALVTTVLSPAWTTDWMSQAGRRKLAEYGIAPGRRPAGAVRRRAGRLPALRLGRYRADRRIRLHRLQGAVALPRLPGAVRCLQVPLSR